MTPAQLASVCVSSASGMTQAHVLAVAIKNALADYRAKHGGAKL